MYGIDRSDRDNHYVLFYNMGGSDTEVSVVKYSTAYDSSSKKQVEHIEILAETSD